MAGVTYGSFEEASDGDSDFVAVKIDNNGTVLWQWQVI